MAPLPGLSAPETERMPLVAPVLAMAAITAAQPTQRGKAPPVRDTTAVAPKKAVPAGATGAASTNAAECNPAVMSGGSSWRAARRQLRGRRRC